MINRAEQQKQYRLAHKEEAKKYARNYRLVNKERINERQRQYYQEHIEHARAVRLKYHYDHRDERLTYWKRHEMQRKIKVLTHYGNGKCVCARCGYDKLVALTIDHINNDGYKETKSGHGFYRKLELSGYPEGYQTLCMNCQFIKRNEYENNKTV